MATNARVGSAHPVAQNIQSTVRLIDPTQAQNILDAMEYTHQRNISRVHVAMLAREMTEGRFIAGTPIRIAIIGNGEHLLDGQHRLSAVVASGKAQIFTVIEEIATIDGAAWTYGHIDTGRKRAFSDLTRSLDVTQRTGLTATEINALAASMDFIAGDLDRLTHERKLTTTQRLDLIDLYATEMRHFVSITKNKGMEPIARRSLQRAYVIAFAMLVLRYAAPIARVNEFWTGVVFDDRIASNDPRKHVHRHLTQTVMNAKDASGRNVVSPDYGVRFLAVAFNAFMEDRPLKQVKVYDVTAPVKIFGVPDDCAAWLKP